MAGPPPQRARRRNRCHRRQRAGEGRCRRRVRWDRADPQPSPSPHRSCRWRVPRRRAWPLGPHRARSMNPGRSGVARRSLPVRAPRRGRVTDRRARGPHPSRLSRRAGPLSSDWSLVAAPEELPGPLISALLRDSLPRRPPGREQRAIDRAVVPPEQRPLFAVIGDLLGRRRVVLAPQDVPIQQRTISAMTSGRVSSGWWIRTPTV